MLTSTPDESEGVVDLSLRQEKLVLYRRSNRGPTQPWEYFLIVPIMIGIAGHYLYKCAKKKSEDSDYHNNTYQPLLVTDATPTITADAPTEQP